MRSWLTRLGRVLAVLGIACVCLVAGEAASFAGASKVTFADYCTGAALAPVVSTAYPGENLARLGGYVDMFYPVHYRGGISMVPDAAVVVGGPVTCP